MLEWSNLRPSRSRSVSELDDEEQVEFLSDLGIAEPGLNKARRETYSLLGLQTYFTAGQKKSERGPSKKATKPLKPQASFTQTLSGASSVQRSTPFPTSSNTKPRRG